MVQSNYIAFDGAAAIAGDLVAVLDVGVPAELSHTTATATSAP
jgi:hypothetical protein